MKGFPTIKIGCHLDFPYFQRITIIFSVIFYAGNTIEVSVNANIQLYLVDGYQVGFRKQYNKHWSDEPNHTGMVFRSGNGMPKSPKLFLLFDSIIQGPTDFFLKWPDSTCLRPAGHIVCITHTTVAFILRQHVNKRACLVPIKTDLQNRYLQFADPQNSQMYFKPIPSFK